MAVTHAFKSRNPKTELKKEKNNNNNKKAHLFLDLAPYGPRKHGFE